MPKEPIGKNCLKILQVSLRKTKEEKDNMADSITELHLRSLYKKSL